MDIEGLKRRIYEIMEAEETEDKIAHGFNAFITILILLNIAAVTIGTVDYYADTYGGFLFTFEAISVAIFTVEYGLRIWSCTSSEKRDSAIKDRLLFMLTPLLLVDLVAILPFYLYFIAIDLRFLRAFRLVRSTRFLRTIRMLRSAKLERESGGLSNLEEVIINKKSDLMSAFFVVFILYFVGSALMYTIEGGAGSQSFSSIPESLWWGINTLTNANTEINPATPLGKMIAAGIAFLGVLLIALPTAIITSGYRELTGEEKKCPYCDEPLDKN